MLFYERMIVVTNQIALDETELRESFVRASGPGGQNVNKVSTAVELRFDARRSPSLPDDIALRLLRLAGARATKDGVIVILAQRFRTQEMNRADARERLIEMIRRAAVVPKKRKATRPTRAAVERRIAAKSRRSAVKRARSGRSDAE